MKEIFWGSLSYTLSAECKSASIHSIKFVNLERSIKLLYFLLGITVFQECEIPNLVKVVHCCVVCAIRISNSSMLKGQM